MNLNRNCYACGYTWPTWVGSRCPRCGRSHRVFQIGGAQGNPKGDEMSSFGDDLIQAMTEALAHAKGEGTAIVHAPHDPRTDRRRKQGKMK